MFLYIFFVIIVVLLTSAFARKLLFEKLLVVKHTLGYFLHSQLTFFLFKFLIKSQLFWNSIRVDLAKLFKDLVFLCIYMNNFLNIKAVYKVFCDYIGCANHYLINVLAWQGHQNTFLASLKGELIALVILNHVIVPNTNVQEISTFFSSS